MACTLRPGHRTWKGSRDEEGYRTYNIVWLIDTALTDGPANVFQTPGLPLPGSIWNFGTDIDVWAWCRRDVTATIHEEKEGEAARIWKIEQRFSSKPPSRSGNNREPGSQGCKDLNVEDPLLQPSTVSGGTQKYQTEGRFDRYGNPILSSSWEPIQGDKNQWDANRPTVKVVYNSATLRLDLLVGYVDTLNLYSLWGLAAGAIKLSGYSWEKKVYGQCYIYYTISLDFEIRFEGWDRTFLDEGTKILNGHWGLGTGKAGTADDESTGWVTDSLWQTSGGFAGLFPPDRFNPSHFVRATDRQGNPIQVVLDGHGRPFDSTNATSGTSDDVAGKIHVEYYGRSDFMLLGGIPLVL